MPLPAFPSIQLPDVDGFSEQYIDSTIRTPTEAGYVQTRPRYTRDRRVWRLPWEKTPLSDADYEVLRAFIIQVRVCAEMFTWVHPFRKTSHTVRFSAIGEFRLVDAGDGTPGWTGSVTLEEV